MVAIILDLADLLPGLGLGGGEGQGQLGEPGDGFLDGALLIPEDAAQGVGLGGASFGELALGFVGEGFGFGFDVRPEAAKSAAAEKEPAGRVTSSGCSVKLLAVWYHPSLLKQRGYGSRGAWMANYDNGYKLLFSHASVVADLLRGFVKEDWVKDVNLKTLERVEGSFVTSDLRSRETDMLWKVQWKGGSLYIFVLLEFQSKVDHFMAVRGMTYHGLLLENLIKEKAFTSSGRLPPVFVLVLYNGSAPWGAALNVADLIEPLPGGLEVYRPHVGYVLLDAARIPEMDLEPARNIAVALFRLEQSRDVQKFRQEIIRFMANPEVEEAVRISVHTWLTQVLMPSRFPDLPLTEAQSLEEVQTMLAERVMEWTREWEAEGFQKGKQEGRQEGVRAFQDFLLSEMVERFGSVPEPIRRRVEEAQDLDELKTLGKRLLASSSLADLGV